MEFRGEGMIKRSQTEMEDILEKAIEAEDADESSWPGMSYEEGVSATLRWIMGETDESPMADE
jgi:hypothetical protein